MKYHFTGTQSTGKTTLLKELSQSHPNYEIITEVVRCLQKNMNININEKGNEASQILIFNAYLQKVLFQENYISDRSLIDVIAYTKYIAENSPEFDNTILSIQEQLLDFVVKNNLIGTIFYIPIEIPLFLDGVRSSNEDFRKEIDKNILYYLKKFDILYIKVSGSKDERLLILNKYIL